MKFFQDNEILLKFMLINVCTGTWVGMVNFIIPVFALSLHASSFEIGLIRGLSGIGDLILVLPAGLMIDYFGSRKMYIFSCIAGGLATVILSLAGTPFMLIVIMIFYGMARSIRNTSLNASFFQHMSVIGNRKGGWYKGSMTIGAEFLGSLIGGALAVAMSFTGYFMTASAILLMPIIIVLSPRSCSNNFMAFSNGKRSGFNGSFKYYCRLLRNKILLSATITECVHSAFYFTFSTFLTIMVIKDLGLTVTLAAILISIRGVADIIVVFFGGRLLEYNNNYLYFVSFAMSSLGLLLLGTVRDVPLLMLAAVILGICAGIVSLLTFTQVGSIEGERGKISSVFTFGQKIGTVTGPVIGGIIGEWVGIHAIFLFFIPVFLAVALYNLAEGRKAGSAAKLLSS